MYEVWGALASLFAEFILATLLDYVSNYKLKKN